MDHWLQNGKLEPSSAHPTAAPSKFKDANQDVTDQFFYSGQGEL